MSRTSLAARVPTAAQTITVAVLGQPWLIAPLRERLGAPGALGAAWQVWGGDDLAGAASVDLALCPSPELIRVLLSRFPAAAVLGLVPADDSGAAVVSALDAGALVCIRGADVGLVAAYLQSVARRRGLLTRWAG